MGRCNKWKINTKLWKQVEDIGINQFEFSVLKRWWNKDKYLIEITKSQNGVKRFTRNSVKGNEIKKISTPSFHFRLTPKSISFFFSVYQVHFCAQSESNIHEYKFTVLPPFHFTFHCLRMQHILNGHSVHRVKERIWRNEKKNHSIYPSECAVY